MHSQLAAQNSNLQVHGDILVNVECTGVICEIQLPPNYSDSTERSFAQCHKCIDLREQAMGLIENLLIPTQKVSRVERSQFHITGKK